LSVALVVDASVGLKWVLREPDSRWAELLLNTETDLYIPDFWLYEAANVLWVQVLKRRLTAKEAREGLALLQNFVPPTSTADMGLLEIALDIGMVVDHSPYDTLYAAFALAIGARGVVMADRPFERNLRRHPDPVLAALALPLDEWAAGCGLSLPGGESI
jgi:predicted nucleic acid-binding protein